MEIGVNLSHIFAEQGSEVPCFSTFLAETRSSDEPNAAQKDMVMGSFNVCGIGVTNLVMTLVAIGLIDRLGRKPLFLYGIAVMILCLLILAFGFSGLAGSNVIVGYLVVGSLFTFVAAFALSLGAVCGLIVSEIYPQQVRGAAMGIVIVANWVCQIIVALTYPSLVAIFGAAATFLLYAVIGAAGFLFCYFLVPETRGLTLEQIEQNWRSAKPPRKW